MSSDYAYDDQVSFPPREQMYLERGKRSLTADTISLQAQFFPFFILTLTGLVTLPLTYTLLRSSTDDDALAPRIKTDYKPQHAGVVEGLRNAQKRKQRRVKRALVVVLGWAIMAGMVYLIMVTQRTVLKIWNPYDILGISDVSLRFCELPSDIGIRIANRHYRSPPPRSKSSHTTRSFPSSSTPTRLGLIQPRTRRSSQ